MMPSYRDTTHLYDVMQALFEELQARPGNPVDALGRSRLVIRLQIAAPQGIILIDGRARPVSVTYGDGKKARPDLDVRLSAETLHRILLDELSLKEALARKQITVRGPVWKTLSLADIFREGRELYPRIAAERQSD